MWPPQKMTSDSFSTLDPLIGRMPTPMKAARMISLDRNRSKKIWIPSSSPLREIASSNGGASPSNSVLKDIAKGKNMRKMARSKLKKEKKDQMLMGLKNKLSGDVSSYVPKQSLII